MESYSLSFEEVTLPGPLRGRAVFPAGFAGFDGHFPGRPILPGFMHIQLAVDFLERVYPKSTLGWVAEAKFTRAIGPGEEVELELRPTGEALAYEATLTVGGEACSRFRLCLRQEGPPVGR